ncbi:MAG: ABC transporter permease [Chloroflexi bacterium]|nr:ABC transporter permease [Chloroflexota bacterium]
MTSYVARRLLLSVPVFIVVSLLIFMLMRIIPGDVALVMLTGGEGLRGATEERLASLRRDLGLDRPLQEQYLAWMAGLARLDLGKSFKSDEPVLSEIGRALPVTAELAILATLISLIIAIPVGVISAVHQDRVLDYVFRVVTVGGIAMPVFWTGTLTILFLVALFRWIPPLGFSGLTSDPVKNLQQMVWPALALGYNHSAMLGRMTRSCMLEVLRQDYVRTARSKGLTERAVIYYHAFKNALLPVVTVAGFQFGYMLGGTMLMEIVFMLPGLGTTLVESILGRDYPMVQNIVLLIAMMQIAVNLGVDLTYGWLDPRIRYR